MAKISLVLPNYSQKVVDTLKIWGVTSFEITPDKEWIEIYGVTKVQAIELLELIPDTKPYYANDDKPEIIKWLTKIYFKQATTNNLNDIYSYLDENDSLDILRDRAVMDLNINIPADILAKLGKEVFDSLTKIMEGHNL